MLPATRSLVAGFRREAHLLIRRSQFMSTARGAQVSPRERQDPLGFHKSSDDRSHQMRYHLEPTKHCQDDFKQLVKNDTDAKRIRLILLELEAARESALGTPAELREQDMAHLMELPTISKRKKFFNYLFRRQIAQMSVKIKKEERRLELESKPKMPTKMREGIFPIIRDSQENLYYNWRLASAAALGQQLVIDCSFEDSMKHEEMNSFGTQLQCLYHLNKLARDPFDLILSDVPKSGRIDGCIDKSLPNVHSANCLVTKSNDSYLEMFPHRRIVYLSPNSNKIIKKWDHDAVFVIGGIVNKSSELPLTLAKAKRQGIEHAKLPVGHYIPDFRIGSSKAFALHVIVDILLTVKMTNDWRMAFTKVPKRFLAMSKFGSKSDLEEVHERI